MYCINAEGLIQTSGLWGTNMDKPRAKKQKEYLMDMGPLHRALEWPEGFPETPLKESATHLWGELDPESELGPRILKILINQMCQRVNEVGRMETS